MPYSASNICLIRSWNHSLVKPPMSKPGSPTNETFSFFFKSFCLDEISFRESVTRLSLRTENMKRSYLPKWFHFLNEFSFSTNYHQLNQTETSSFPLTKKNLKDKKKYFQPEILRKKISICGVWCLAIFWTRDLRAVRIICCSLSWNIEERELQHLHWYDLKQAENGFLDASECICLVIFYNKVLLNANQ